MPSPDISRFLSTLKVFSTTFTLFLGPLAIPITFAFWLRICRRYFSSLGRTRHALAVAPMLAYLYSYLKKAEESGKYEQHWLRKFDLFRAFCETDGWRVTSVVPLDPHRQYMFVSHPHGVVPLGWSVYFSHPCRPIMLGASAIFKIPVVREFFLFFGTVAATETALESCVRAGRSVALIPGGVREMMLSRPGNSVYVVSKNSGFIRSALKHGLPLVPSISFGEHDLYHQQLIPLPTSWLEWFKQRTGVYPFYLSGRFFCFLPNKTNLHVIFGTPIELPCLPYPSAEQVAYFHRLFYAEFEKLFYEWRDKVGYSHLELVLVDSMQECQNTIQSTKSSATPQLEAVKTNSRL